MSSPGSEQTNTAFRAFGARTLAQANIGRRSGRWHATKGTKNWSHKGHKDHQAKEHEARHLQNHSLYPFLHGAVMEVQQVAESKTGSLQVRDHLRFMHFV